MSFLEESSNVRLNPSRILELNSEVGGGWCYPQERNYRAYMLGVAALLSVRNFDQRSFSYIVVEMSLIQIHFIAISQYAQLIRTQSYRRHNGPPGFIVIV